MLVVLARHRCEAVVVRRRDPKEKPR